MQLCSSERGARPPELPGTSAVIQGLADAISLQDESLGLQKAAKRQCGVTFKVGILTIWPHCELSGFMSGCVVGVGVGAGVDADSAGFWLLTSDL